MNRETIMTALFATLQGAAAWGTTGRRLIFWTQVSQQPAMFLRNAGEEIHASPTGLPAKVTMECEVWLYNKTDASGTPGAGLNDLIDAVQAALRPPPGRPQTLGGLVSHCRIEGKIDLHPGDLDGQAIAVIPVKILVPTFGG